MRKEYRSKVRSKRAEVKLQRDKGDAEGGDLRRARVDVDQFARPPKPETKSKLKRRLEKGNPQSK
jgi:hypothetical protein